MFDDKTVILANGAFPTHDVPLDALRNAARIVCCDGAVDKLLLETGPEPTWIVGDGDSISAEARAYFAENCRFTAEQETNDLTKAFRFCISQGWTDLIILGATGGREDHTLGNLSLLADFVQEADVRLLTNTGFFTPLIGEGRSTAAPLQSVAGQQVSLIACDAGMRVSAEGLKYPVRDLPLTRWWQGTLNEALGASFEVSFEGGVLLVFQTYEQHADDADFTDLR